MLESEARDRLKMLVAAGEEPALSDDEIATLLRMARVAARPAGARITAVEVVPDDYRPFVANSAYALGALAVPTLRNAHVYQVTIAGTSAAEPVWPTGTASSIASGGVTFVEAGAALWPGAWDVMRAVSEGWYVKAGKTATTYAFHGPGAEVLTRQELFDHCVRMAEMYSRKTLPPPPGAS